MVLFLEGDLFLGRRYKGGRGRFPSSLESSGGFRCNGSKDTLGRDEVSSLLSDLGVVHCRTLSSPGSR